jgi:phospholipase/lecithinase/hemolysin
MQFIRWNNQFGRFISRLFLHFFIALSCLLPLSAFAVTIDKIVVFGDSLSDNGNISKIFKGQIPRNPPYYSGRFSNGVMWIEKVAAHFGLNTNSSDQFYDHAFAGAWGSDENDTDPLSYFTLSSEIDDYLTFESKHDSSEANHLFVIWIGNNDYLAGDVRLDIKTATDKTVNAIVSGIQTLMQDGAKNFLVLNLTDLGQTPSSADAGSDTVKRRRELSYAHNAKLAERLNTLRQQTHANIIELDLMPYFNDLVKNPVVHQLENVDTPCYDGDYGDVDEPNTTAKIYNKKYDLRYNSLLKHTASPSRSHTAKSWKTCSNPDKYIYWDHLHPTGYVHDMLGDYALKILGEHGVHGIL